MAAALNLPSLVRPQPHFFDMPPEIHSAPLPQQSRGEFHTKEEEHSDDLGDDGNMSDDGLDQVEGETGAQRKARRNVNTAEKRANHNAIERARRENLNGRFMELAEALPTMNANKRPSKNTIVVKALEFVQSARMREQALEQQNVNLRAEINELRGKLGMPPIPSSAGPLSAALHAKAHGRVVHGGHTAHHVVKHQAVAEHASPYPMAAQAPQSLFRQQHQPQPARHLAHHPNGASYGGPYLPQDPIAAAYYGFVGGVDAARRPSLGGSSANETGSDSDVSLVHTPPQLANSFPTVAAAFPYDDHTTVAPRGLPGPILEYPSCSGAGSLPSITAAGVTGWSSIGGVGYPGGNYSIYN